MEAIRKEAERIAEIKPAWLESIQPAIDTAEQRTLRLSLKDVPFLVHKPASEEQITVAKSFFTVIDPALQEDRLTKKDVNKCEEYH